MTKSLTTRVTLILCSLVAHPVGAVGQTEGLMAEQQSCLLGDMKFSPGSVVRFANQYKVCTDVFTWEATDETPIGCFFGGEYYSVGAVREISSKTPDVAVCAPEGNWQVVKKD